MAAMGNKQKEGDEADKDSPGREGGLGDRILSDTVPVDREFLILLLLSRWALLARVWATFESIPLAWHRFKAAMLSPVGF